MRYAITVKRKGHPGAKWRRVYISPTGKFKLSREKGANRSGMGSTEAARARIWAQKHFFKIRVSRVNTNPFKFIERKFDLKRSSGDHEARGVHSRGSYHYRSAPWGGVEAYDYGDAKNKTADLVAAGKHARSEAHLWAEVFGPFDWHIKNGVVLRGAFPNHGDHLHLARTIPL